MPWRSLAGMEGLLATSACENMVGKGDSGSGYARTNSSTDGWMGG
jgi:hypothetical protein